VLVEGWFDEIQDDIALAAATHAFDMHLVLDRTSPRVKAVDHGVRSYISHLRRPTRSTTELAKSRAWAASTLAKGST
jgi:hypothetical protein